MNNVYSFDTVIDRFGTFSAKWNVSEDVIPMSVADMDIPVPNIMINELQRASSLGIYGYTELPNNYYQVISNYIHNQYSYYVNNEKIVFCPRIIQAIAIYIRSFTEINDGICILTPSYNPISEIIKYNNRKLYNSTLIYKDKKYFINFDSLEDCFKKSKIFILISPHNPTGTVWDRNTLYKIISLAKKHNVFIISDDVHADFTFTQEKHCLISSLDPWIANNSMICLSPAKTFNIPGLEISNVIIENNNTREVFKKEIIALGIHNPNYFSIPAIMTAYQSCTDWIIHLKKYIENNKVIVSHFLKENIPSLEIVESKGTYLLWINYEKLNINEKRLIHWFHNLSKVKISQGSEFGCGGDGFFRINVAMPQKRLLDALTRIKTGFYLLNNKEI